MTAMAKLQFSHFRANFVAAREIHSYVFCQSLFDRVVFDMNDTMTHMTSDTCHVIWLNSLKYQNTNFRISCFILSHRGCFTLSAVAETYSKMYPNDYILP